MKTLVVVMFVPLMLPAQAVTQAPTAEQQIAQAVLPLPESLRAGATVLGYDAKLTLVTLRKGSNAMVCTADRPGDDQFDVRCYHESFMPAIQRARELRSQGLQGSAVDQEMEKEIKAGSIQLPNHATAGYRMLGPISAYDPATNAVTSEIRSWQSLHLPFQTAVDLTLPTESKRDMPYVMASGTWWAHVMIEH
jgi:hypothetical protein